MTAVFTQPTATLNELVLDIPPFWSNPRSFTGLDKKSIQELAEDIRAKRKAGNEQPVAVPLKVQLVTVEGRSEPMKLVIDGQRRHIAAGDAGLKEVPVSYRTEEPVPLTKEFATELLSEAMAIGNLRETLSSYEQAVAARGLKDGGRNGKEVSRVIRRSEAWVSRMTKALTKATPTLIADWKAGKITDEQFKDLSDVKIEDQVEALKETRVARESGNKSDARAKVKELAEKFKANRKPSKAELKRQAKAERAEKKAAKTKPAKDVPKPKASPTPPSRSELAHLAELGKVKPATHEYAKGVMDAIRYVLGEMPETKFAKPWHVYLSRVSVSVAVGAGVNKKVGKLLVGRRANSQGTKRKVTASELAAKSKGKRGARREKKQAARDQVRKALKKVGKR